METGKDENIVKMLKKNKNKITKLDFENCVVSGYKNETKGKRKLRARIVEDLKKFNETPTAPPPSPERDKKNVGKSPVLLLKMTSVCLKKGEESSSTSTTPTPSKNNNNNNNSPVLYAKKKICSPVLKIKMESTTPPKPSSSSSSPSLVYFHSKRKIVFDDGGERKICKYLKNNRRKRKKSGKIFPTFEFSNSNDTSAVESETFQRKHDEFEKFKMAETEDDIYKIGENVCSSFPVTDDDENDVIKEEKEEENKNIKSQKSDSFVQISSVESESFFDTHRTSQNISNRSLSSLSSNDCYHSMSIRRKADDGDDDKDKEETPEIIRKTKGNNNYVDTKKNVKR